MAAHGPRKKGGEMKKKSIVFLFVLMVFITASGQGSIGEGPADSRRDQNNSQFLGLDLSILYFESNESLEAGQTYWGWPFGFRLGYESWGDSGRLSVGLDLSLGKMVNRFDFLARSAAYSLSWAYEKKIFDFAAGRGVLYIGGGLSAGSDFYFYDQFDQSHGYWLTRYAAIFHQTVSYRLSPGSLVYLEVCVPVAAFISRPPARRLYKTDIGKISYLLKKLNEDLKLVTVDDLQVFLFSLTYRIKIGNRLAGLLSWEYEYTCSRLPEGKPLKSAANSLSLGLKYGLNKRR